MDPFKYEGGATQGNISIPLPQCGFSCGGYVEGYVSDDHNVWGLDVGVETGFGPTILAAAHTTAERTDKLLWIFPGDWLNNTGKDKLEGPWLLGCRLLSMCGAQ